MLAATVQQYLQQQGLDATAIAGLATLDRRAEEPAIQALCARYQWQRVGFAAAALRAVAVPHPSARAAQAIGTPSVAEAAALLAAQQASSPPLHSQLLVPKHIYRPLGAGALVLAIAQAQPEGTHETRQPWEPPR